MTQEKAMNMSNEQAIKLLQSMMLMMCDQHGCPVSDVYFALEKAVEALTGQQWIPCSERLPEDGQFVLMTIRRMGEHYNHEPFISVGYISWNRSTWWCAHDGNCKSHDVRVDAWMSLPEPYKKGK